LETRSLILGCDAYLLHVVLEQVLVQMEELDHARLHAAKLALPDERTLWVKGH